MGQRRLDRAGRARPLPHRGCGETAQLLDLAEGEPVFVFERLLRERNGVRVAHRLYLPFATCLDTPLEADPFHTPADLYRILSAAGHEL